MICDLAETYNIYDYESHPVNLIATLVSGLRDNSRVSMVYSNLSITPEEYFLISIYDDLNWLCWTKTKNAQKKKNKPVPFIEKLKKQQKKDKVIAFSSGEEFLARYNELAKR